MIDRPANAILIFAAAERIGAAPTFWGALA